MCLGTVCLGAVCLGTVCLGIVCLSVVCLSVVCLGIVCLGIVCLGIVCLSTVCLVIVCLRYLFRACIALEQLGARAPYREVSFISECASTHCLLVTRLTECLLIWSAFGVARTTQMPPSLPGRLSGPLRLDRSSLLTLLH